MEPSAWPLAPESRAEVKQLGLSLGLAAGAPVVASPEPKAIATAEALTGARAVVMGEFVEVRKPWFETPEAHRTATLAYLAGETRDGWEPLEVAVERFSRGVSRLIAGGHRLVVTHGTVMAAWLGSVGAIADSGRFWLGLRMPDHFVIDAARATTAD